jgi:hypothetical protein
MPAGRRHGLTPSIERCDDELHRFVRILMLPDSDRTPAVLRHQPVRLGVTLSISLDLSSPPVRVGRRPCGMLRTTVPEATVDKNGHPGPPEDDIGFTTDVR